MGADGTLHIVPCDSLKVENHDLYCRMKKKWPGKTHRILGRKCWYWYSDTNGNKYPVVKEDDEWKYSYLKERLGELQCYENITCWT